MTPTWRSECGTATLFNADCVEVLREMDSDSVDSVVTDPPAGIGFMGKAWDHDKGGRDSWIAWMQGVAVEALRVLKPGGHALVWALPRTSHWTATAWENAGFEVRDVVHFLFGTGFPKSKNIGCRCRKGVLQCHNENMPNMRDGMGAEDALPDEAKQDVLASLRGNYDANDGTHNEKGVSDLRDVRQGVSPEKQEASKSLPVLLERLQGCVDVSERKSTSSTSGDMPEREGDEEAGKRSDWIKQSGMEGRSDVLAEARKLQADQIYSMSGRVFNDGSEGRLHHGTPPVCGEIFGPVLDANGGGASQESQSAGQSNREPGTFQKQQGSQKSGVDSRGVCKKCGGLIDWSGYGTALKPAAEHWILLRKPLIGTVAANVLEHGTGALNIDGCRVPTNPDVDDARLGGNGSWSTDKMAKNAYEGGYSGVPQGSSTIGRWPANLVLDDSECVVREFPITTSGKPCGVRNTEGGFGGKYGSIPVTGIGDTGSAARFYYCAKASAQDRNDGCDGLPLGDAPGSKRSQPAEGRSDALGQPRTNFHPTVKPVSLMRWLCRLITPPNGVCLDMFAGSGSTGKGAVLEGFRFIGIERESEYFPITVARIKHAINTRVGVKPEQPMIPGMEPSKIMQPALL